MNSRRTINLPDRPANLPFSDAALVGDTLYISGRIGIDPATGLAPPEVDLELRILFDGFSAVLKEAGMMRNGRFEMMGIAVRKSC
jgi:2-iminobutanoate/2-iminopropanoate deaminase